jgi:hypothetical protein
MRRSRQPITSPDQSSTRKASAIRRRLRADARRRCAALNGYRQSGHVVIRAARKNVAEKAFFDKAAKIALCRGALDEDLNPCYGVRLPP